MRRLVAQDHQVFTEDGKTVAIFGDGIMLTDDADWEQRKADAILFAAAPEMRTAILATIRGLEGEFGQARARVNFPELYEAVAKASA